MEGTCQAVTRGLLAGLHGEPGEERRDTLVTLTEAEWMALVGLAVRTRVAPLLLHRLGQRRALDLMPDRARGVLTERAKISVVRALRNQCEFKRFAQALHARGVSVVALKGIHLASEVYSIAALREMNDIDVLVDRENVKTASEVAATLGFAPRASVPWEVSLAVAHHLGFAKPGVLLEVHWRLTESEGIPIDTAALRDRTVRFSLEPSSRVLSPEDTLVHIAVHGATVHLFEQGLRPIYDVAALIDRFGSTLRWTDLVARAVTWRSERAVGLLLELAQRHAGACVPAEVLDALSAGRRTPPHVMDTSLALCVADISPRNLPSAAAARLLSQEPLSRRLAHLKKHIWSSPEELAALYPGTVAQIRARILRYRLKRAYDLVKRRGPQVLGLALHRDAPVRSWVNQRNDIAGWLRGT